MGAVKRTHRLAREWQQLGKRLHRMAQRYEAQRGKDAWRRALCDAYERLMDNPEFLSGGGDD